MTANLDNIVVILWEPQDDINIGNTVRACKNFGVTDIRLVRPRVADPERISISAPKAMDVIEAMPSCASLKEALEGCVYAIATTARPRHRQQICTEPRGAAQKAAEIAASGQGKAAYIFGREDSGLPNSVLERCQSVVTIPTRPDYSSLNLGQAVLLNMWEVFRVASDTQIEQPAVRVGRVDGEFPPAELASMEAMFGLIEKVIERTEFFKTPTHDHIMRIIRGVLVRAGLDQREQSTWFGIFRELERSLKHNSPG